METSKIELCTNCAAQLPALGYFCGKCLTQFKCKNCNSILEKDYAGCINCGTPRSRIEDSQQSIPVNTFHLHETPSERTIDATFSDSVGQDLAGMLRDTYTSKLIASSNFANSDDKIDTNKNDQSKEEYQEAQVVTPNNALPNDKKSHNSKQTFKETLPSEYPALKAIAMKNLPSNETEWIVVYAFYASNFGQKIFTRQDIVNKYEESNRKNPNRMKGISTYIINAVKGNYINPINGTDYSVLEKGNEKAVEIIKRTKSSPPKAINVRTKHNEDDKSEGVAEGETKKNKKAISRPGKLPKRLTNLDFYPTGKESLKDFMNKFSANNDHEKNLLFTYYLREILKIEGITSDHIYTCYDELQLRVPLNLKQVIRNTASVKGWIITEDGNIFETTKGSNQIKLWLKKD